jgi:hypothetical protein
MTSRPRNHAREHDGLDHRHDSMRENHAKGYFEIRLFNADFLGICYFVQNAVTRYTTACSSVQVVDITFTKHHL